MKILSKNASDTETKDTCNNDKYHTPEQALKILFGYDSCKRCVVILVNDGSQNIGFCDLTSKKYKLARLLPRIVQK